MEVKVMWYRFCNVFILEIWTIFYLNFNLLNGWFMIAKVLKFYGNKQHSYLLLKGLWNNILATKRKKTKRGCFSYQ